jgi:hypothetical protein
VTGSGDKETGVSRSDHPFGDASRTMRKIHYLLGALMILAGCQTHPASSEPKQVSVAELGSETDHLICFNYVGSDADFHYFTTAERKRYKVPRAEWNNPRPFPLEGGIQLFMTVKDGKLTVPDPKEMATLSEDDVLHRPHKKKRP